MGWKQEINAVVANALRRLARWAQASEGRKGRGLVLLAIVVYFPAFAGGFVWDDWIFVTEPLIRRLDGILSIWLSPSEIRHELHYWPVVYTSFWIEHKLWGLHPMGYHVVNIVLHGLNSVLVWRLLVGLAVPGAWLAAAVWAVHPVHVESVAWIIERKDLASALFYLAAALVWLRFTDAPDTRRYLLSLVLFALALLSKSIAVTLPAALLLLQWWRQGHVTWRDAALLAPFFALAAGVTLADLVGYFHRLDPTLALDFSLLERLLIAARALWVYVRQLVCPAYLPVFYPRWEVRSDDVMGWFGVAALIALGAVLWLARERTGRGPLTGALFYALTLAPVLGFVYFSFMRIAFVADRFQYLASIGPLAVFLGMAVHQSGRLESRSRAIAVIIAMVVLAVLGALSWRQSGIYRDDLVFSRHITELNPQQVYGRILLAHALTKWDHDGEALVEARRAVELADDHGVGSGVAHGVLGSVLLAQDLAVEAETVLRRSLTLRPRSPWGSPRTLQLARSLIRQGRYEEGFVLYREIRKEEPGNDLAYLFEGRALLESGRYEDALDAFGRALAMVRDLGNEPGLHALAGEALRKLGRFDAAAASLDQALALNPDHIRTLLSRADLERDRQRAAGFSSGADDAPEGAHRPAASDDAAERKARAGVWLVEARKRCETLIEREPKRAVVRVLLGAVLMRMGEYGAAVASLDDALALSPSRPVVREAHRILGRIRERQGLTEAAAGHYRSALDIYPLDAAALERLASLHLARAQYEDAVPLYRRLVLATPFVARAHLHLGMTLYHLGHPSEALVAVDRALELAPGLEAARRLRWRLRDAAGDS